MAATYADVFAMTDLVRCKVTTEETTAKTYYFVTASEFSADAATSDGDEKDLRVKNVIYASNKTADLVKGYDIKLTDNRFTPEVYALIDGGTLSKDGTTGKYTYSAPVIGQPVTRTKFTLTLYTEIKEGSDVTGYMAMEFPHCTGKPISPSAKDNEFFAPELDIESRAAAGAAPMTIAEMAELPAMA